VGFRFHRRISFGRHFRINLSKSGVSENIGTRGAWLTLGKRGRRETVGLPGSGLSYTAKSRASEGLPAAAVLVLIILAIVFVLGAAVVLM
jgi:hypothetical protein